MGHIIHSQGPMIMEVLMIFHDIVTDNGVLNPQNPRKMSCFIQFNTRLPDVLLIFPT